MKIVLRKTSIYFLFKCLLNYKIFNEVLFSFMLMKLKLLFIAILLMVGCGKNKKANDISASEVEPVEHVETKAIDIPLEIYDYASLETFLNLKDDKIHVVNFWATWCAPCVKELPYFEKLNAAYKEKGVEVMLVSLDFPHLYDKKLKPFIVKNNLQSKVVALDDADMNAWIPKVDEGWSGSIPATVIYKNGDSHFYEQSFTYEELEKEVKKML